MYILLRRRTKEVEVGIRKPRGLWRLWGAGTRSTAYQTAERGQTVEEAPL